MDDERLKRRTFKIPVSFFEGLEDSVSSKIGKQERGGFVRVLKPAALLACSFVFVLAIGYAILSLTGTYGSDMGKSALVEEINDDYTVSEEDFIEYIAQNLSLEEIREFLTMESDNNTNQQ